MNGYACGVFVFTFGFLLLFLLLLGLFFGAMIEIKRVQALGRAASLGRLFAFQAG